MKNLQPVNGDYVSLIEKLCNESLKELLKQGKTSSTNSIQKVSLPKKQTVIKDPAYKKVNQPQAQNKEVKNTKTNITVNKVKVEQVKNTNNTKQNKSNAPAFFIFIFLILFFLFVFFDLPFETVFIFFVFGYVCLIIKKVSNKKKKEDK